MTRGEIKHDLGRTVLDLIDANLPPEIQQDSKRYEEVLDQAVEAFPHTSLPELVEGMIGGILHV